MRNKKKAGFMKKNGIISFCKLTLLLVGLFPPTVKEKTPEAVGLNGAPPPPSKQIIVIQLRLHSHYVCFVFFGQVLSVDSISSLS